MTLELPPKKKVQDFETWDIEKLRKGYHLLKLSYLAKSIQLDRLERMRALLTELIDEVKE
jgi:hypothetical protein